MDNFRERNPDGRILILGDFNMEISQLKSFQIEPGVSDILELEWIDFGPTAKTRTQNSQRERQIDHILTDAVYSNARKLK